MVCTIKLRCCPLALVTESWQTSDVAKTKFRTFSLYAQILTLCAHVYAMYTGNNGSLTAQLWCCRPWGAHTAFTNRAGNVVRHIRQRHGEVELCTTAWAKMYECIVTFDLLPDATSLPSGSAAVGHAEGSPQAVGTVHLCEAPGAFISATNHFIRTQRYDCLL